MQRSSELGSTIVKGRTRVRARYPGAIEPLCVSMIAFAIDNPRPDPPVAFRWRDDSPCQKRSKACSAAWVEAGTGVGDGDIRSVCQRFDSEREGGITLSVVHRIGDENAYQLDEQSFVGADHRSGRRGIGRDGTIGLDGLSVLCGTPDDTAQIDLLAPQWASFIEADQREQVLDQVGHAIRFRGEPAHDIIQLLLLAKRALAVEIEVAAHGGQRCAQLVGGIGHELRRRSARSRSSSMTLNAMPSLPASVRGSVSIAR